MTIQHANFVWKSGRYESLPFKGHYQLDIHRPLVFKELSDDIHRLLTHSLPLKSLEIVALEGVKLTVPQSLNVRIPQGSKVVFPSEMQGITHESMHVTAPKNLEISVPKSSKANAGLIRMMHAKPGIHSRSKWFYNWIQPELTSDAFLAQELAESFRYWTEIYWTTYENACQTPACVVGFRKQLHWAFWKPILRFAMKIPFEKKYVHDQLVQILWRLKWNGSPRPCFETNPRAEASGPFSSKCNVVDPMVWKSFLGLVDAFNTFEFYAPLDPKIYQTSSIPSEYQDLMERWPVFNSSFDAMQHFISLPSDSTMCVDEDSWVNLNEFIARLYALECKYASTTDTPSRCILQKGKSAICEALRLYPSHKVKDNRKRTKEQWRTSLSIAQVWIAQHGKRILDASFQDVCDALNIKAKDISVDAEYGRQYLRDQNQEDISDRLDWLHWMKYLTDGPNPDDYVALALRETILFNMRSIWTDFLTEQRLRQDGSDAFIEKVFESRYWQNNMIAAIEDEAKRCGEGTPRSTREILQTKRQSCYRVVTEQDISYGKYEDLLVNVSSATEEELKSLYRPLARATPNFEDVQNQTELRVSLADGRQLLPKQLTQTSGVEPLHYGGCKHVKGLFKQDVRDKIALQGPHTIPDETERLEEPAMTGLFATKPPSTGLSYAAKQRQSVFVGKPRYSYESSQAEALHRESFQAATLREVGINGAFSQSNTLGGKFSSAVSSHSVTPRKLNGPWREKQSRLMG